MIYIKHYCHHNNSIERDNLNREVEANKHKYGSCGHDKLILYLDKLNNYLKDFKKN